MNFHRLCLVRIKLLSLWVVYFGSEINAGLKGWEVCWTDACMNHMVRSAAVWCDVWLFCPEVHWACAEVEFSLVVSRETQRIKQMSHAVWSSIKLNDSINNRPSISFTVLLCAFHTLCWHWQTYHNGFTNTHDDVLVFSQNKNTLQEIVLLQFCIMQIIIALLLV